MAETAPVYLENVDVKVERDGDRVVAEGSIQGVVIFVTRFEPKDAERIGGDMFNQASDILEEQGAKSS